jgi:hypothetical protein
LKADAFLAKQLPQPLVGDVVDHPLGDQVVGEFRETPGRKRLAEVARDREGDSLDRLALGQREAGRAAASVTRVERLEAVAVEVVDHFAHRVGIGEDDLGDPGCRHRLRRQEHHLRPAPGDDRAA